MWYLGDSQILLVLGFYMFVSEMHKCCFYNLRNGRKDKNGRRWTTFGLDNEKQISDIFC